MNSDSLFGARLKAERKRLNLTQKAAATAAGVSREMFGKYELGKATPGGEVLFKLGEGGFDLEFLRTGADGTSRAAAQAAKVAGLARQRMLESGLARGSEIEDVVYSIAREPEAEFSRARSEAEQQLLSDLRRCSKIDQDALMHLAARLAELGR